MKQSKYIRLSGADPVTAIAQATGELANLGGKLADLKMMKTQIDQMDKQAKLTEQLKMEDQIAMMIESVNIIARTLPALNITAEKNQLVDLKRDFADLNVDIENWINRINYLDNHVVWAKKEEKELNSRVVRDTKAQNEIIAEIEKIKISVEDKLNKYIIANPPPKQSSSQQSSGSNNQTSTNNQSGDSSGSGGNNSAPSNKKYIWIGLAAFVVVGGGVAAIALTSNKN